ncbi:MAG: TIGR04283 family arsenosugar biosynthesis glycosyltransferase [Polyangiaceae bacterium]|nr:TIGR04283 family arsenosugar biosynthesis glycosyltransferase [Polyangiaceae bacterium]
MANHSRPRLSVVIPTLNEAKRLPTLLAHLSRLNGLYEVVVSDGASEDGTLDVAMGSEFDGRLTLVEGPRGRARQLNAGAAQSGGELLLFLHADTLPPLDTAYWVQRLLRQPGVVAGAFRTWHVHDATLERLARSHLGRTDTPEPGGPWWLHLADIRSRYTTLPYGDQGLFITRERFERAGGFPEQLLMEDLEFSLRLRNLGQIRTAPSCIVVSGRRFEAHPLLDTCLVNTFPALYRLGVPASRLANWYRNTR